MTRALKALQIHFARGWNQLLASLWQNLQGKTATGWQGIDKFAVAAIRNAPALNRSTPKVRLGRTRR